MVNNSVVNNLFQANLVIIFKLSKYFVKQKEFFVYILLFR